MKRKKEPTTYQLFNSKKIYMIVPNNIFKNKTSFLRFCKELFEDKKMKNFKEHIEMMIDVYGFKNRTRQINVSINNGITLVVCPLPVLCLQMLNSLGIIKNEAKS